MYADALAVYDHVSRNHSKVTIIGRSLDTDMATYLATQRGVEGLVLIRAIRQYRERGVRSVPGFSGEVHAEEQLRFRRQGWQHHCRDAYHYGRER